MKVLELSNVDMYGRRFNGFDLISDFKKNKEINVNQIVLNKLSDNDNVETLFKNSLLNKFLYYFKNFEDNIISVHNVMSITTPALFDSKEYKEADIIHIHMFHNSNYSLYTIEKIAMEKKIIISLHDPWLLTGRCVHFYDCNLWKTGCYKCDHLSTSFPLKKDNCNALWEYKKRIFLNPNINVIYTTEWMKKNVELSPIMKNVKKHFVPLGIDTDKFIKKSTSAARKHFNIDQNDIVLFFRAQKEFKGTNYIVEALKHVVSDRNITLLTCSEKGLLKELRNRYNTIDLGQVDEEELIAAYNACDFFLMPSTGESFGYMAIEAMSCSKPVIIFDNTALPSTTNAPEIGVLVKNLDSVDLADKIKWLIDNKSERINRGKKGRDYVEKEFNYQSYLNNIEKLYNYVYNAKKIDYIANKIEDTDNNINNLKCYLNVFTKKHFKKNSLIYKKLIFNVKKTDSNKIYFHSDEAVKLFDNYTKTIYDYVIQNNTKDIRVIYKIKSKIRNLIINIKDHGVKVVVNNIIKKIMEK